MNYRISIGSACAVLALAVLCAAPALAQDDPGAAKKSADKDFVEIEFVGAKRESTSAEGAQKDVQRITVKGKAPLLPEGTLIQFEVKLGTEPIDRFEATLTKTKRISATHDLRQLDGFVKGLYLRWSVDSTLQSPEVIEEMKKQPDIFWLESSPWNDSVVDKKFDVGDEKDFAKQNADIKKYFSTELEKLYAIEKNLEEKKKSVLAKSSFMDKNQKLDTKAWQNWMERDVREPLRQTQREIDANLKSMRFADVKMSRDLGYLLGISKAIAQLSSEVSRAVYKASELKELDQRDVRPENLQADGKKGKKFLDQVFDLLADSQDIMNPRTGKVGGEGEEDEK